MEGAREGAGPLGGGRKKTHGLPANLDALLQRSGGGGAGIGILAGLDGWRHRDKQRQLEAASLRVSTAKAAQSEPAVGSVLDEGVEVVEAAGQRRGMQDT